jgi:hypothetical protein
MREREGNTRGGDNIIFKGTKVKIDLIDFMDRVLPRKREEAEFEKSHRHTHTITGKIKRIENIKKEKKIKK